MNRVFVQSSLLIVKKKNKKRGDCLQCTEIEETDKIIVKINLNWIIIKKAADK